ncbi:MAG: hypothetical protein AAF514_02505 [Verrucomicrobiota bacterium]
MIWFALLGCERRETVAPRFRTEKSEILLSLSVGKWESVQLRRTSVGSKVVGYRWEFHQSDRDRRGPGAFTRTIECFLYAWASDVTVVVERPDRLELVFSFEGFNDSKSELHVLAVAETSWGRASVTFEGRGELFPEFVERLEKIKAEGWEDEFDKAWRIPMGYEVEAVR